MQRPCPAYSLQPTDLQSTDEDQDDIDTQAEIGIARLLFDDYGLAGKSSPQTGHRLDPFLGHIGESIEAAFYSSFLLILRGSSACAADTFPTSPSNPTPELSSHRSAPPATIPLPTRPIVSHLTSLFVQYCSDLLYFVSPKMIETQVQTIYALHENNCFAIKDVKEVWILIYLMLALGTIHQGLSLGLQTTGKMKGNRPFFSTGCNQH